MAITPGGRVGDASPLGAGKRRLTDYEREVTHALLRQGHSLHDAIRIARGVIDKAAATGRWSRGKAKANVQAGAIASVAQRASLSMEDPMTDTKLGWDESLHPRGPHGRFGPSNKGRGSRSIARGKSKLPTDKRPDQRYARKVRLAQQEQARRIVASQGLGRGRFKPSPNPRKVDSHDPKFRLPMNFALEEAARRDIQLGDGWKAFDAARGKHPRTRKVAKAIQRHRTRTPAYRATRDKASFKAHYEKHYKHVEDTLAANQHLATDKTHAKMVDGKLVFNAERARMHARLVNEEYTRQAKTAKAQKRALFLGGLPGAGKSSAIKDGNPHGVNAKDYITVNPDIFKELLAKNGMVPKMSGLTPLEASALVHEESAHLADLLAHRARANHMNILHDITINSVGSVDKRKVPLDAAGYKSKALFIDIPHSMSEQRVRDRHLSGYKAFLADRTGKHLGQRLVPSSFIAGGASKKGSSSANRDAFDAVKHKFAAYKIIDNKDAKHATKTTPEVAGKVIESRGRF